MRQTGPNSPTAAVDDASVGIISWTTPANVEAADAVYAGATFTAGGQISHYLKATDFDFALPPGATVEGIKVDILRAVGGISYYVQDYRVRLVKGGVVGATDKANTGVNWPAAPAYASYGDGADLWGDTWGVGDINGAGFGVVLSATRAAGGSGTQYGIVDHIRVTIYYTAPGAPLRHRAVIIDSAGVVKGQVMA